MEGWLEVKIDPLKSSCLFSAHFFFFPPTISQKAYITFRLFSHWQSKSNCNNSLKYLSIFLKIHCFHSLDFWKITQCSLPARKFYDLEENFISNIKYATVQTSGTFPSYTNETNAAFPGCPSHVESSIKIPALSHADHLLAGWSWKTLLWASVFSFPHLYNRDNCIKLARMIRCNDARKTLDSG